MRVADAKDRDGAPDLDDLRRRLYGPGSTGDDLERYRRAAGRRSIEPASAPPPASARTRSPSRRRSLGLLVAAVALVVVLVAVGFWLGGRRAATMDAVRVAPAPTAPASLQAPVSVQVPVQDQLTVTAADRDALVRELDASTRSHPLSDYLYSHPDSRPDEIRTVQRAQSEEHRGSGTGTVRLDPSALAARGGRATIVLVVDRAGKAGWRAAAATVPGAATRSAVTVAQTMSPIAGIPVTATFRYSVPAPTRLTIAVPAGVRWSVLVAFTN